ncbi:MAG: FMN-binding negative transcriptional regulator [Oceanicaulis sp.]|nr:FMN-binding negative transcriptional regulator [Oceanicaulis sp.]
MSWPPHAFAVADPAKAQAVLGAWPFAPIVVQGADGFVAARPPVVLARGADGRVSALPGHVSRAHPVLRAIGEGAPGLALFSGPHAYVSASAYPSKAIHGRAVPTWNYVAAEAHGDLAAFEDEAGLRALLHALPDRFEAGRAQPWSVDDAPADYVCALMKGIVGLRLTVREVRAVKKLSQNKAGEEFDGVTAFLDAEPEPGARQTAALMKELERG